MSPIEKAISDIVAVQVAAVEKMLLEKLNISQDRKLTFIEACEFLGMSEYTLRNLCKAKRLPHRTIGTEGSKNPRYLFSKNSLIQWMKEEENRNWIR
ncbi:helix-turn-helix domain-containing protein [Paenibacillus sp. NPDC058177]|uniref:helix-turn-helix domain-containing protein n=1 Tax=Paenibacillus sp. NPDC058177 TaxID=3346369 RepID=UPI0036DA1698